MDRRALDSYSLRCMSRFSVQAELARLTELNAELCGTFPSITGKKEPPPDADAWKDVPDKYQTQFSPKPGGS